MKNLQNANMKPEDYLEEDPTFGLARELSKQVQAEIDGLDRSAGGAEVIDPNRRVRSRTRRILNYGCLFNF